MKIEIRQAEKQDMKYVLELIKELATFEREPEAVVIKLEDLIQHGFGLLEEYTHRYGKIHSCQTAMNAAEKVFEEKTGRTLLCHKEATPFAFAGPDVFKYDTSIDTLTAYKRYISSKPWAASNYLRDPSKKPNWL